MRQLMVTDRSVNLPPLLKGGPGNLPPLFNGGQGGIYTPPVALKELFPGDGKAPEIDSSFKDEDQPAGERRILCALCGHGITSPEARIAVDGAHSHTFVNPAGVVFRIGCFSAAGGCLVAGEPTMEFTWFRGHSWRFAVCGNCRKHLGWHFSSGGGTFFGLMLDSITEPD